jgi:hypothetical protein
MPGKENGRSLYDARAADLFPTKILLDNRGELAIK